MPIDVSGFNVPAQDIRESAGLVRLADTMQRREEMEYRRSRDKEYDDYRKYQIVKDTINPEDVAVGNATFDEWSSSETKKVLNEVMSDPAMKNGSFVDIYGMMQSKWQPVMSAANKMKAGFQQIDANVKLSGTEDTNLATDDLAADAKLKLVQDTMPMGQDGKRVFNTSNHNPDKNYVKDILDSEDSWRYVKGPEPLIKYIENHKTEDVTLEKHMPDKSIVPYKGKKSAFSKLNITPGPDGVIKSGEEPKFNLITEDDYVTDEDGTTQPVKLLDKEIYEQHIEKIPANKKILNAMWNKHKQEHGIKSKNATEEDKRKRAFAVGVFNQHDPSQIPRGVSQHLPRNTTNNNFNVGGGGAETNKLYDRIHGEVKRLKDYGEGKIKPSLLKYDEQALIMSFVRGIEGNENINPAQVDIKLTDMDELDIYVDGVSKGVLPKLGSNIKVQANVAGKKAIVAEGEPNKKAQPQGKPKEDLRNKYKY